jgi:transaldolase
MEPVHRSSGGQDGFVSIEVSPDLAYETDETVKEARRLFSTIGRKNVLVKVPGTKQGLPAIEHLTAEGININVTLLFSVKRYEEVIEAYIKGLEKRVNLGKPVHEIASVASFFVSRVDSLTDKLLQEHLSTASSKAEGDRIKSLFGRAAVANAKMAYKSYVEIFASQRVLALKKEGARIQRILWGSTGTKNPAYSDIKYVEELIAPDSINTMPEATLMAFKDHGRPKITIEDRLEEAAGSLRELKSIGIDMDQVTDSLERDGVKLFSDSFFSLLKEIAKKRDSFLQQN